ncbi:HNH endonuclease signature motif containing protein [Modestobacter marinus]|uniref:HNH endonuclease signature motif containing protein n=1 Tax=Modestobacter marinus TaxID=477641 RepID=UPI001C9452A9|nr:HNH endonuclease signature motif containing protein [Modestobacter marinus]
MFELLSALTRDAESRLEQELQRLVDEWTAAAEAQARAEAGLAAVGAAFEEGIATLAEVREAQAEIGRQQGQQARSLATFARSRPASLDRPDHEVGAAAAATRAARPEVLVPVSEWAVDEVAVALGISGSAAGRLLAESLNLVDRLPDTLAALDAGTLTWTHARVLIELVAPLSEEVQQVAEQRLLRRVAGKTPAQLRAAARRVVQRLDAAAIGRRVAEAIRDRRVVVHPGDDGMATFAAILPLPVARAMRNALEQYAEAAATEGDERTKAQRMTDCLVDLVLRPGEHGLAPVQARMTVVATVRTLLGGDEPGEVDGEPVPAEMVRELAYSLGLLPPPEGAAPVLRGADGRPEGDGPPAGDGPPEGPADRATGPGDARALGQLLGVRTVRGTALVGRPEIALVDELRGQLLALTDAAGLRAGQALGPPPETPGYRPSVPLDRFVRLRDRRCRFPGCRALPRRCDLDHTVPWPAGPTSAENLCCLCRHHHRLSHQAPGWRLRAAADGGLEWTTPTGQVLVTHPPRAGADDDLAPLGSETPLGFEARPGVGRPPNEPTPDDPPF